MLLDWVTGSLGYEHFPAETWQKLILLGDRIMRYCPRTGDVVWESMAWDSIKSDSHQVNFRVGGDAVHVMGSPARCVGTGDTVFGSAESKDMDIQGCLRAMALHVSAVIGIDFPCKGFQIRLWNVHRVDVTASYLLDNLEDVRAGLAVLRECEGGRYRVSQTSGDTVYWNHLSHLQSGKAYAKGPQLRKHTAKKGYTGLKYTERDYRMSERLLRLELKLSSQFWRERAGKPWYEFKGSDFVDKWNSYFLRMIGDAEMVNEDDLLEKLVNVCPTQAQAKAAFRCFSDIRIRGWEKAKFLYLNKRGVPSTSWYRHMSHLRLAGLGDMDIAKGEIVQLRKKIITAQLVHSWDELRRAA